MGLNPPGAVRRSGDRRTRIRAVTVAAAVVLVMAGATVGGQWVLSANRGPRPQPATSQTPGPTPSEQSPTTPPSTPPTSAPASSSAPPDGPGSIPASAYLQLKDTNGDIPPEHRLSEDMLPDLCAAKYPSDGSIRARRTMHVTFWTAPKPGHIPDGTLDQTITTYKGDGGTRFMAELRAAVTSCPTYKPESTTYRHKLLTAPRLGDERILFERRYPATDLQGTPIGGDEFRLITAVRFGNVVMVLNEQGWEGGSTDRKAFDRLTGTAVNRVRSWLN